MTQAYCVDAMLTFVSTNWLAGLREGMESLPEDLQCLAHLCFSDAERWSQADDVAVRGLGLRASHTSSTMRECCHNESTTFDKKFMSTPLASEASAIYIMVY